MGAHMVEGAAPREGLWNDPDFRRAFTASYGFDGPREPAISSAEQELLQSVLPMLEGERFAAAVSRLQASRLADESAAIAFTLGNIFFQTGELQAAERAYRQAIERFPGFRRARQNLGFCLIRQGRLSEALTHLLAAAQSGAGDGPLYGLIGYAYLGSNQAASAIPAYEKALMYQPDSLDWRLGRLQAMYATGEYQRAAALAGEMLEQMPQRTDIWILQANALLAMGDSESAATNLEILRRMGAADSNALLLLGDIHLNRNLPELAAATYTEALGREPLPDASRVLRLAGGLADRQAWEQVRNLADQLDQRYRDHLSPAQTQERMLLQARLARAAGEDDEYRDILEAVVQQNPLHGRALLLLGDAAYNQRDWAQAELHLRRAAELANYEADARVRLARVLLQGGRTADAIRELERAQALRPQETIARYLEDLRRRQR